MSNALKIAAAMGGGARSSLLQIINSLGLQTNLKLCLDAGDAASYDPSVQTAKWLDTSGNGCDFYRGSSTGGDAAEPTFNGTAGALTSNEYFSFDGNDYFSYDSANETWMDALHNDGAIWSAFAMVNLPSTSIINIFTTGAAATYYGAGIGLNTNTLRLSVTTPTTAQNSNASAGAVTTSAWGPLGYGLSENGGSSGSSFIITGGSTGTWNASNSLVASNAPGPATIGASAAKTNLLPAGSKLACLAVWQGTALTTTNLSDIYNAIKGRFGL